MWGFYMAEESAKIKLPEPDMFLKSLVKTRTILLCGEVNKELSEKIVKQLFMLEAESDDPISLFIDSPGGDVDAGFAIYDAIRFVQPKVYLIGMGLVASAAALILLAVPQKQRLGFSNSRYLLHQPLSGIRGVSIEIEIHAEELEKLRKKLNQLIADATDHTVEEVEKNTDRDYWLNAEEALTYNLIEKVVTERADFTKYTKT